MYYGDELSTMASGPSSSYLLWFCNSEMNVDTQMPTESGGWYKRVKQARWGLGTGWRAYTPAKRAVATQLLLTATPWECRIAKFSKFSRRVGNLDSFGLCNLLIFKCWRQIHIFSSTQGAKLKKCLQAEFGQWPPVRNFLF